MCKFRAICILERKPESQVFTMRVCKPISQGLYLKPQVSLRGSRGNPHIHTFQNNLPESWWWSVLLAVSSFRDFLFSVSYPAFHLSDSGSLPQKRKSHSCLQETREWVEVAAPEPKNSIPIYFSSVASRHPKHSVRNESPTVGSAQSALFSVFLFHPLPLSCADYPSLALNLASRF